MPDPNAGPDTDPGEELVEVVDTDGRVLDVVPRRRIRAERLRHRCTYVAVVRGPAFTVNTVAERGLLNPDAEIVVHQRADWKDTYPSYWDLAFGGLCGVGEGWAESAERELAEEAGLEDVPLLELGPTAFEDNTNRVVGMSYVARWPDDPVCVDGEVVAVDHVPLGRLQRWVDETMVCPDSAAVVTPRLLRLMA